MPARSEDSIKWASFSSSNGHGESATSLRTRDQRHVGFPLRFQASMLGISKIATEPNKRSWKKPGKLPWEIQ